MSIKNLPESKHFNLIQLTDGVYACVHKPGGGAYSNAGIIDLGDRTLVVDAFDTMAAGRDLRKAAESLFSRPVETIVLTHPHSDHWIGASVFDEETAFITGKTIRDVVLEWGENMLEDYKDPSAWQDYLKGMEAQFKTEKDESIRAGLEKAIRRTRYTLAEMEEFRPHYPEQTFENGVTFHGTVREVELRSMGRGHSEEDVVLLLHQDRVAFIGDIGFFDTQPFLGFCDLDRYREQLQFFMDSDFRVLVPGHGPVGYGRNDITLQLRYFEVMEGLVSDVVQRGGSFEDAMKISLPDPFDKWLIGGMGRFEANLRYLFGFLGVVVPE